MKGAVGAAMRARLRGGGGVSRVGVELHLATGGHTCDPQTTQCTRFFSATSQEVLLVRLLADFRDGIKIFTYLKAFNL